MSVHGESLRVDLAQVHRAVEALLQHVEQTTGGVVELDKDFFWSISPDDLYNVYQEPGPLSVGQLSESLGHLEAIAEGRSSVIGYGMVWLADVLRAVGQGVSE